MSWSRTRFFIGREENIFGLFFNVKKVSIPLANLAGAPKEIVIPLKPKSLTGSDDDADCGTVNLKVNFPVFFFRLK